MSSFQMIGQLNSVNWWLEHNYGRIQSVSFDEKSQHNFPSTIEYHRGQFFGRCYSSCAPPTLATSLLITDYCRILYADNSQLVLIERREEKDILESRLTGCIDQPGWLQIALISTRKTEILWYAISPRVKDIDNLPICLSDSLTSTVSTVRDLGIMQTSDLSVLTHVNQLVSRCFYQLRRIKSYQSMPWRPGQ